MFDWDKIVIDVDNNIVDLTAGEVALLIAADADTVSWGNITGDLTQQADLMLELDSKIDVDSPEFTGTPRTPTPPAGNSSTRIANTEFVQAAVQGGINGIFPINYQTQVTNKPNLGTLASKDKVNYNTEILNKPTLGTLASKNTVDYSSEVINKPRLGSLATKSSVNYETEVTNKPTLGSLALKDKVSYTTDVTNKPSFGSLAYQNSVDYSTQVTNKPTIPTFPSNTPASFGTLASKDSVNYETEVTNKPTIPVLPANTPSSFGTLASKNSVNYETEVYNKPSSTPTKLFYVDGTNGDDNNDGSLQYPFKKINKAIEESIPYGITTIYIFGGDYNENLTIENKSIILGRTTRGGEGVTNPHLRIIGQTIPQQGGVYFNPSTITVKNGYLSIIGDDTTIVSQAQDCINAENSVVRCNTVDQLNFINQSPNWGATSYRCCITLDNSRLLSRSFLKFASSSEWTIHGVVARMGSFVDFDEAITSDGLQSVFHMSNSNGYYRQLQGTYQAILDNTDSSTKIVQ